MAGQLRLLLVGKTGAGKSKTGNFILGKPAFKSSRCGSSITKHAKSSTAVFEGKTIKVTDSPGLFDTDESDQEVSKAVIDCLEKTHPGPHAILFVVNGSSRLTAEELNSYTRVKVFMGPEVTSHMIVVITHEDALAKDGMTLQDYVKTAPPRFKQMIKETSQRVILLDATVQDEHYRIQKMRELMKLVSGFRGTHFECPLSKLTPSAQRDEMNRRLMQAQEMETRKNEFVNSVKKERENALLAKQHAERLLVVETNRSNEAERQRQAEQTKREEAESQTAILQGQLGTAEEETRNAQTERDTATKQIETLQRDLERTQRQLQQPRQSQKSAKGVLTVVGGVVGTAAGAVLAPITFGASVPIGAAAGFAYGNILGRIADNA